MANVLRERFGSHEKRPPVSSVVLVVVLASFVVAGAIWMWHMAIDVAMAVISQIAFELDGHV